jgi:hypothetical protein
VDLTAGELKPRSLDRRRTTLKSLAPYFHGTAIRNFSRAQCERWAKERGTLIAPRPSITDFPKRIIAEELKRRGEGRRTWRSGPRAIRWNWRWRRGSDGRRH